MLRCKNRSTRRQIRPHKEVASPQTATVIKHHVDSAAGMANQDDRPTPTISG